MTICILTQSNKKNLKKLLLSFRTIQYLSHRPILKFRYDKILKYTVIQASNISGIPYMLHRTHPESK